MPPPATKPRSGANSPYSSAVMIGSRKYSANQASSEPKIFRTPSSERIVAFLGLGLEQPLDRLDVAAIGRGR